MPRSSRVIIDQEDTWHSTARFVTFDMVALGSAWAQHEPVGLAGRMAACCLNPSSLPVRINQPSAYFEFQHAGPPSVTSALPAGEIPPFGEIKKRSGRSAAQISGVGRHRSKRPTRWRFEDLWQSPTGDISHAFKLPARPCAAASRNSSVPPSISGMA